MPKTMSKVQNNCRYDTTQNHREYGFVLHRILQYLDRIGVSTKQSFLVYFLNNFPIYYCISTL